MASSIKLNSCGNQADHGSVFDQRLRRGTGKWSAVDSGLHGVTGSTTNTFIKISEICEREARLPRLDRNTLLLFPSVLTDTLIEVMYVLCDDK